MKDCADFWFYLTQVIIHGTTKNYAEYLRTAADNYVKTEEALRDAAGNLHTGI